MFKKLYNKISDNFINWLTREPPPAEVPPCDFERLKHEIRPGDVILIEGRSRVANVIRTLTQSSWTHAALYIGRSHDIEDEELRKFTDQYRSKGTSRLIVEGLPGKGIVISPLHNYRNHHIRICRPIGLSAQDAQLVMAYALRSVGQGYNVKHILDFARFLLPWSILPRRWGSTLFRTPSGQPESGICSALIAEAFISVKFPILPFVKSDNESIEYIHRNPYIFVPKDFDYSPWFEIIKYPILSPEEQLPYYRRMPWTSEDILHQGRGEFIRPQTNKTSDNNTPSQPEKSDDSDKEKP